MPRNQIDISTDLISVAVVKIAGYPSSSCRRRRVVVVVVVLFSVVAVLSLSCRLLSLDRSVVVVSFVVVDEWISMCFCGCGSKK